MNPLIKKEIRLLLPAWIAAMLLAIVPVFIWHLFWTAKAGPDAWESFNYLLSFDVPLMVAFGILCLGIASFGQEFSSNTFAVLLAQPAERQRLWTVKSNVLAIASASVWLVAVLLISWQFNSLGNVIHHHAEDQEISPFEALAFLTVSALAVGTGGLWTTLLLRQIAGAFWVTLIAPLAIVFGIGLVLGFFPIPDPVINVITAFVLLGYSIVGFYWARRLFFQAQDAQWTGGNFLFPWRGKNVELTGSFVRVPRNRFLALTWKEIRLHEVNLFIAVILLAVHLGALVLHPMVSNRNTKMILECVWSLWLVMPLLIGSSAVGEERKLAVMESQLCLPVSRRLQFAIKFFVALILSIVLGAVMPSVIEGLRNLGMDLPRYEIYLAATIIFFISFYASTLARSTLHAVGIAIVLPIVVSLGFAGFCWLAFHMMLLGNQDYYRGYENICHAFLMLALCVLVFPFVLTCLMFWNFKWLHQSWQVVKFNVTTILIAFVLLFALTNAIYNRPWELLSPIESPHGLARLSQKASVKFSIDSHSEKLFTLLPDGRLWQEQISIGWFGSGWLNSHAFNFQKWSPYLSTGKFIGGSNWTEFASGNLYALGLKQNGTLWCLPQDGNQMGRAQIGSATDWLKITRVWMPFNLDGFLLLKKDGTLWLWGTNGVSYAKPADVSYAAKTKLDLATLPVRISSETNWTDILPFTFYESLIKKSDGSLWSLAWNGNTNTLIQETNLDYPWNSFAYDGDFSAEIKTNGELWLFEQPVHWQWSGIPLYAEKIRLDSEPVWKAISLDEYSDCLILLRQDGTLWKWNLWEHQTFHPVELGHHSDWVALLKGSWMSIALAADGSLWAWSQPSDHVWLAPSRKPVYLGNVLEDSP